MLVAKHIKSNCHKSSYNFCSSAACVWNSGSGTFAKWKMASIPDFDGGWRFDIIYYFIQMHFSSLDNLNHPIRKDLDYALESPLLLPCNLLCNITKHKKKICDKCWMFYLNVVTLNMLTFDSLWKIIFVWCAKFVGFILNSHFYPCMPGQNGACLWTFNKGNALHNERLMSQFIILISLLYFFSFI